MRKFDSVSDVISKARTQIETTIFFSAEREWKAANGELPGRNQLRRESLIVSRLQKALFAG
jgi:hypothetical protein